MTRGHSTVYTCISMYSPTHYWKVFQGDMSHTYFGSIHRDKSDYEASVNITNAEDLIYAMSTEAGVRSSGMTPWQCVYQYDGSRPYSDLSFISYQSHCII